MPIVYVSALRFHKLLKSPPYQYGVRFDILMQWLGESLSVSLNGCLVPVLGSKLDIEASKRIAFSICDLKSSPRSFELCGVG